MIQDNLFQSGKCLKAWEKPHLLTGQISSMRPKKHSSGRSTMQIIQVSIKSRIDLNCGLQALTNQPEQPEATVLGENQRTKLVEMYSKPSYISRWWLYWLYFLCNQHFSTFF